MAESWFSQEQEKYEYLQFVVPDVNSIPRGKVVKGKFKEKTAKHGLDMPRCICVVGPNCEIDSSLCDLLGFGNNELRPCLDTLTPWPWVGKEGRRFGNVLCDFVMYDGTPDLSSPRQIMKAQLEALREQHGLVLKSAFEYEFDVFKTDTLEPLGGDKTSAWDIRHCGMHQDLLCELTDLLELMAVKVSTLMPQFSPGQWEITTEPQEGVRGGDVAFYVKNAVKGFFKTRGYTATFMAKPTVENMGYVWRRYGAQMFPYALTLEMSFGGRIQNDHSKFYKIVHELYKLKGDEEKTAMLDKTDPDLLSATARHWLAGILAHSPALTALCCPTLNCYRLLHQFTTPTKINWGVDDRGVLVRVRNAHDNVFLENRLPSGPCSPYLAIAATVAAGLDGLNRKLPCPKAMDVDQAAELPKTLAEALDALEKDEQLCSLLGDRFVGSFTKNKREYEVKKFETTVLNTEEKQMEFERKMYMDSL